VPRRTTYGDERGGETRRDGGAEASNSEQRAEARSGEMAGADARAGRAVERAIAQRRDPARHVVAPRQLALALFLL